MINSVQLKANQKNSKLGGVKTPEGKAISKYNALKHGILRSSITDYEKEMYPNILQEFEDEYKPETTTEKILVERMTLCYLKLYRLQKAETEYIKSLLNPHMEKETLPTWGTEVVSIGFSPIVSVEGIEKLLAIYSRYETTIENRLFRILHEIQRFQSLRKGGSLIDPHTVDVNLVGSFGETT